MMMKAAIRSTIIPLLLVAVLAGCHGGSERPRRSQAPVTKVVRDAGVTAKIMRIGSTDHFKMEVSYSGRRDMTWWAYPHATLYDAKGKEVPRPKNAKQPSLFTWQEDERTVVDKGEFVDVANHFGDYRRDNPLVETLVLDAKGLMPGRYRAEPMVTIFEKGKGAHPAMKDPFYAMEMGVAPAKVESCWFTVR